MRIKQIASRYFSDISAIPPVLQSSHLPSLDGLRGVSILIVVIAHLNGHFQIKLLDALFFNGAVGVYIFFVMSGFLITTLLLKERLKTGTISLKNFYIRRVLRIFPVAYLYILVIFILSQLFDLGMSPADYLVAGLYLVNFFHFFSVPYYVNHYWSLSAEEQFYLLIPPLVKLSTKVYRGLIFIILGISFFARFIFERNPTGFWPRFIFDATRNMDGLIIGSLFSVLIFTNLVPWNFIKRYKVALSLILFGLILLLNREPSGFVLRLFFNHTFYSFLIGLLIITNIQPSDDIIYRFLNSKILTRIGVISYSIYIWQQLFTSSLLEKYFPFNVVMLLVVSFASYYLYEKQFLKLKSRFQRTKESAASQQTTLVTANTDAA